MHVVAEEMGRCRPPWRRRVIGEALTRVVQIRDQEISVLTDAGQLEQVPTNLVVFARDALLTDIPRRMRWSPERKRAQRARTVVPILFLSGSAEDSDDADDAFLGKPFTNERLLDALLQPMRRVRPSGG